MAVTKKSLENILEKNIGNYSFNINLFRAFPNACDGLKPVIRRTMYEMGEQKLTPGVQHKKVAAIVGSVLGRWHPHGDASVADALVKAAQPFYIKNPLIDINGNMGSISGDEAAAMRYIECKTTSYGYDMLGDIHKNSVNWTPNYDGSLLEPETLPVKYPNLLINGSYGIGQAYISSIPSHNFNDIADIAIKLIKEPNTPIDEIAKSLRPDYPTGGKIINTSELTNAYKTGSGTVRLRAKISTTKNGDLLITEIPYMTTVGQILNKIQEVCKDGRIDGISDIVDQTNEKNGVKVLIKIKRGYDEAIVEKQLYQLTPLQSTMTFSLIATDGHTFKTYNINELFIRWIDYRKTTLKRIFNYDMAKIRKRIHTIEGLLICLNDIDNVIALIKQASDRKDTIQKLINKYNLSSLQAEAIADLQLYRLSNMNVQSLKDEKVELEDKLKDLSEYFTDPDKLNNYIIAELEEGKKKYGKERLTECTDIDSNFNVEDTVPDANYTLFVTRDNYIKKLTLDIATNSTGCKGRSIGKMKDGDAIISADNVHSKDNLLLFTNLGLVYKLKVYDLKDTNINSYGVLVNTYINLKPNEKVVSALAISDDVYNNEDAYLLFVTTKGQIKRTMLSQYNNISKSGLIAIKLADGDTLVGVKECEEEKDVIIATNNGTANRYSTEDVTLQNRVSMGVRGAFMTTDNDFVVSFDTVDSDRTHIFVISSSGNGKLIEIGSFTAQSRTNKCKLITKLKENEKLVSIKLVTLDSKIVVISAKNMVKVSACDVPVLLRSASPKAVAKLDKGDSVLDCYIEEKNED